MNNALSYLRVSTDTQAEKGFSIPAQQEACIEFAKKRDYEVVGEFIDRGESARSADRPQLQEMLSRCKKDKSIKAVIIHKIDRLARDLTDYGAIKAILKKQEIELLSVTEGIEATPEGQVLEGILASMAQYYSANLGREVSKGMRQKAKNGGWNGPAPYGYKNVQEKVNNCRRAWLEIDESEAYFVRKAFNLYATGNYTEEEVVNTLNQDGFKTKHNNPLRKSSLANWLSNPIYKGVLKWHEIETKGKHQPLVDEETYNKVQFIKEARLAGGNRKRLHKFLLRGIAYCGECGSRITGEIHTTSSGNAIEYYRCQKAQHGYRVKCNQRYAEVDTIEDQFKNIFKSVQLPDSTVEKLHLRIKAILEKEQTLYENSKRALEKQLIDIKRKKKNLLAKLIDSSSISESDKSIYQELQSELNLEEINITKQLNEVENSIANAIKVLEMALFLANRCFSAYKEAPFELRQLLSRAFFQKITIQNKQITQAVLNEPLGYLCRNRLKNNPIFDSSYYGEPCWTLLEYIIHLREKMSNSIKELLGNCYLQTKDIAIK